MNALLFQHGTRETLTRQAREGYAVVVPLAATEQHGPHLPVGTDSMIGEHIALEACKQAAKSAKLLVAPTLAIGCSQHHLAFGGTISVSSAVYLQLLKDIGESLVRCGFRKIVYLNAHGGNEPLMHQAAQDLAVQHDVWTASASYWSLARFALAELQAQETGMVPGHAGGFEASLVASLAPELVRKESIIDDPEARAKHRQHAWINAGPPGSFVGKHGRLTGEDGYTDSALLADAAKGAMYVRAIVEATAQWLVQVGQWMEGGAE